MSTLTNIDIDLQGLEEEIQEPKKRTWKQKLYDLMVKINRIGDRQVVTPLTEVKEEERF